MRGSRFCPRGSRRPRRFLHLGGGNRNSDCQKEKQTSHGEAFHVDAGLLEWVPSAVGMSAGKGSPSAQTAPSSKYSFFQMGTVRLRVSMSQRQASKAADL